MIGGTEKTQHYCENHREKYHLRTNQFFSYWKHNTIYFPVIVQRRQTRFYAERQNLGSTEKSVQDLQQVHRNDYWLEIDNICSEKDGISGH